ncbi:hypothetical protein ACTFIY_007232 [Dictyostelium cf. discoideum]
MISNNNIEKINELENPQIEISFDDVEEINDTQTNRNEKNNQNNNKEYKQKLKEKDYIELLKLIDTAKNYEYPSEEIKQQELKEKEKRVKEIVDEIVKMIEEYKN